MAPQPSILWIVTTQWRAQAIGFAGDVNADTPCLDALAAVSVNYAQAITPHPFGPFARAALLTGQPSPENGVRDYFDPLPIWRGAGPDAGMREPGAKNSRRAQPDSGWTIAHTLGECGYATGFFGKWHLGQRDPGAALVGGQHARTIVPADARGGFAYWEGFESGFLLNDPWLHGTGLEQPLQFAGYQSDVVCERAARWIQARPPGRESPAAPPPARSLTQPWFCLVSLEPPHPPYHAPAADVPAPAPAGLVLGDNVPRGGEVETKARAELSGYYAHITATDRAIGRLLTAVDAAEVERNRPPPIVVFTSVHGDMHGAHGLFRKGWPHEESVRVPLLVRLPPRLKSAQGVTSPALVSLLDLPLWTQAWAEEGGPEVSGAEAGTEFQRISMPSVVPVPHQCDRVWRGVRTQARKLVLNPDGSPWLLFDLGNDPGEQRNLAHDAAWRGELDRLQAWV